MAVIALGVYGNVSRPSDASESHAAAPPTSELATSVVTVPRTSTTPDPTTTTTTTPTTTVPQSTVPAPTTTGAVPGSYNALDVLAVTPVANEVQDGYSRDLFPEGLDANGDGCPTRAEVLIRSSSTPAQTASGCQVVAGQWLSPYDGLTYSDPSQLEVDHVVSLKEAWDSGAYAWDQTRRAAFANDLDDPRSLVAVTASINASKGDKDPSNWLPPLETDQCTYIGNWLAIKARWALSMDESEYGRIRNMLNGPCAGWMIAPFTLAAPTPPPTTTAPPPPPPAPAPAAPPATSQTNVYYANCTAVRAAGAAPIHVGEPGYSRKLDRDGDGVACE